MAKTQATSKQTKTVIILARYALKTNGKPNGTICYLVRNGNNAEHCITLSTNGHATCTCKAGEKGMKKCYHRDACLAAEQARQGEQPTVEPTEITADWTNSCTRCGASFQTDDIRDKLCFACRQADNRREMASLGRAVESRMSSIEQDLTRRLGRGLDQVRAEQAPLSSNNKAFSLMR